MRDIFYLFITLIFLGTEAFFSGSEIAIISLNRLRLRGLVRSGSQPATLLSSMLKKPERILSATLLGTNLSTIISSALLTSLFYRYSRHYAVLITLLVLTPLTLILGEIVPKTLFQKHSETIALKIAYPIRFFYYLFYPLTLLFSGLANRLLGTLGVDAGTERIFVTKEEIKRLVQADKEEGEIFEQDERDMLERIFVFGDTTAKEVLVPLIEVELIDREATALEVVESSKEKGLTRFPVYYERSDNIIGTVNVFDLLYAKNTREKITNFISPAYYIPGSKRIDNLLREMQSEGLSLVVVVDEYGNNEGIITLEDLLEEIVGEIRDEYDDEEELFQVLADGSYLFDARIELDDIREFCDIELPDDGDYETLGGLILDRLERIPDPGDRLEMDRCSFTILKADGRTIKKVICTLKP
ncbi:MAG: hemolysin family protein [bacterium]